MSQGSARLSLEQSFTKSMQIRPLGAQDGSLVRVYSKPRLTNRNPSRQLDSTARFERLEIARKHARINFTLAFKEAFMYPIDNG
jgi:hypothetical protein